MTALPYKSNLPSQFSVDEWHRLDAIATKHESRMRLAYMRSLRDGRNIDVLQLSKVIIDIMAETAVTTAKVYNLVFNPNSSIYLDTVDKLAQLFVGFVDSGKAREAVKQVLPTGLSLGERRDRLNSTFGLDSRRALSIERYRQERGDSATALKDVERARRDAVRSRGNILSNTETNRAVNYSLEALWLDNQIVSKSDIIYYDNGDYTVDIGNIPKRAKKVWITRRDGRVCSYCDPLDELTIRVGKEFDTYYGYFQTPPAHPQCRCMLILEL